MISTPVAALVLLAALMHAGWNFLVKGGADRLLDTCGVAVGASLLAALFLPFLPMPAPASWPWLAATLSVHIAYFLLLVVAYQRADLSVAYPIMRGTAPLLVAGLMPFLGERVTGGLAGGVVLVGGGILLPTFFGLRQRLLTWSTFGLALANAVVIAMYTIWDGFGVRASGNAVSYAMWLFFLNSWSICVLALWRRGGAAMVEHWRRYWRRTLAGAAMTLGSYGIVLWAMSVASIAAVAALRETSVLFAALLGALVLKESLGAWRIAGAAAVTVGVALIRLG